MGRAQHCATVRTLTHHSPLYFFSTVKLNMGPSDFAVRTHHSCHALTFLITIPICFAFCCSCAWGGKAEIAPRHTSIKQGVRLQYPKFYTFKETYYAIFQFLCISSWTLLESKCDSQFKVILYYLVQTPNSEFFFEKIFTLPFSKPSSD